VSNELLLPYETGDPGTRSAANPLPPGTTFWNSPAVTLATIDGKYTVNQPATITVKPTLIAPAAYEIINVQVWVCDPTTVAGPTTALYPSAAAQMTGNVANKMLTPAQPYLPDPNTPISTVPQFNVTGFLPFPGMTTMPGGHCCLIANCYGMTAPDGTQDGSNLNDVPETLPWDVQHDQHVAQCNIFAEPTPGPQMKVINFPFRAATPLTKGAEQVRLQITQKPPAQLQSLLHSGLLRLGGPKFKGLPIAVSHRPVKFIGLTGGPKEGPVVELELEAHKSRVLAATAELDPAEKPGAAHGFDIVQRDAHGRTQGGLTLVTIVARD
jgi:hypothetical protein